MPANYKLKTLATCAASVFGLQLLAQENVWYSNNTAAAETSADWFDTAIWSGGAIPQDTPEINACVNIFNDLEISENTVDISALWLKIAGKGLSITNGASLTIGGNVVLDGSIAASDAYLRIGRDSALTVEGSIGLSNSNAFYATLVNDGGDVTAASLNGGSFVINGGSFTSNGAINANTNIKMYGGQFSQANNIWNGVSISLFGTSGFKMAHNTQITTSRVTMAGGKLYNDVAENLTVNGTELIFGAMDEASATFKAASAHSIEMGNKLNVWDGGENRTSFRFNIGKENLIVSNEAANLRANAFVYSANEIEFHETSSGETTTRVSVQLDFSNIDFRD